jgi:hypothetical protein
MNPATRQRPLPAKRAAIGLLNLLGPAAVAAALLALPAATHAQKPPAASGLPAPRTVTEAEARAVRQVVQAQLKAMAADDARAAFGYAAPAIRDMYGTADNFLAMVRAAYPMVYRPASTQFLKPQRQPSGEIFLDVRLVDGEGTAWLATYSLDRMKAGEWRITGCVVERTRGRTV